MEKNDWIPISSALKCSNRDNNDYAKILNIYLMITRKCFSEEYKKELSSRQDDLIYAITQFAQRPRTLKLCIYAKMNL